MPSPNHITVLGGGPAGLATGAAARDRELETVVLESGRYTLLERISERLQRGDNGMVADLTKQAIDTGIPPTEIIRDRGHRNDLRVIVGGASMSEDCADEIGADGQSYDAAGAVELVKILVGAA